MDVVAAIDGFTSIYASLNSDQSLEFLNWVKENINGEITLLSKTFNVNRLLITLNYRSPRALELLNVWI